jgi:hypothetical protein
VAAGELFRAARARGAAGGRVRVRAALGEGACVRRRIWAAGEAGGRAGVVALLAPQVAQHLAALDGHSVAFPLVTLARLRPPFAARPPRRRRPPGAAPPDFPRLPPRYDELYKVCAHPRCVLMAAAGADAGRGQPWDAGLCAQQALVAALLTRLHRLAPAMRLTHLVAALRVVARLDPLGLALPGGLDWRRARPDAAPGERAAELPNMSPPDTAPLSVVQDASACAPARPLRLR